MSYTVVNDNGVIQVCASIASRAEMNELGKALANAEKYLPDDPPKTAAEGAARPIDKEQPSAN